MISLHCKPCKNSDMYTCCICLLVCRDTLSELSNVRYLTVMAYIRIRHQGAY